MSLQRTACGVLVALWALPSFAADAPARWSERNLFVYSGDVVIDFREARETSPAGRRILLTDCSTKEFYCSQTVGVFNVAVPRKCGRWKTGDAWNVGPVKTEVLRVEPRYDRPATWADASVYLIGDAGHVFTVKIYKPEAGILEIIYDTSHTHDLVAIAKNDGLAALRAVRVSGQPLLGRTLVTFDPAGQCSSN